MIPMLAAKFGNAIRQVYERLDAVVGQIIERLPKETAVFVVSDHGGGPVVDRTIYLNRYLAQLGLLHYKESATSGLRTFGQKVMRAGFSALRGALSSKQKVRLAALFPEMRQKSELAYSSFTAIDWSRTKAYCSEVLAAPPSIYINLKGVKPEGIVEQKDYQAVVNEVIAKIAELKDPRDGKPVIKKVWRREELFHGPFAHETADLILDWWSEDSFSQPSRAFRKIRISPRSSFGSISLRRTSEWGGTHRLHGILVAAGPIVEDKAKRSRMRA